PLPGRTSLQEQRPCSIRSLLSVYADGAERARAPDRVAGGAIGRNPFPHTRGVAPAGRSRHRDPDPGRRAARDTPVRESVAREDRVRALMDETFATRDYG